MRDAQRDHDRLETRHALAPELSLSSLTTLQDITRQLAADIAAAGDVGQRPDPALSVAARFSVIKKAIADARATTCAPGISEVGDRGLWELVGAAMQRAETQFADLTPDLAATG